MGLLIEIDVSQTSLDSANDRDHRYPSDDMNAQARILHSVE